MRLSEREFANILGGGAGKKPKGFKEVDIQNAQREYLEWNGWFVIRHQQSLGSYKGLSDLTAMKDGWTVYIEAKTATGTLSEDQKDFCEHVISHGGTYVIGRCVEDVKFLCEDSVECLRMRWSGKVVGRE